MERQREKFLFNIFQERYQTFKNFKHTDEPDFLVSDNKETIGIEFTELYKQSGKTGKKPREEEAIKERVLRNAEKMCVEEKIPFLQVGITFTNGIDKNREKFITEELVKIIKNKYPSGHETVNIKNSFGSNMPTEFYSIVITNIAGAKRHFWDSIEASFVVRNFSNQLQDIIDRKAKRLNDYLKNCDRCWLVIAALGSNGSSFYEYSEDMEKFSYHSPFEKVFFIEAFNKDLKELNCNSLAAGQ